MKGRVGCLRKELDMYKRFGKEVHVEFKRYLHRVADAGTRLLFEFRSGLK